MDHMGDLISFDEDNDGKSFPFLFFFNFIFLVLTMSTMFCYSSCYRRDLIHKVRTVFFLRFQCKYYCS